MLNQNLVRGVLLAAIAVFFGANAMRLQVGVLSRTGPGLFPLVISGILLTLAIITIVQSRFAATVPLAFNIRNIVVIVLSLVSFVVASEYVSMMLGIVLLVFIAGYTAKTFSWKRNVAISAALIGVALAFQLLLGLNLGVV